MALHRGREHPLTTNHPCCSPSGLHRIHKVVHPKLDLSKCHPYSIYVHVVGTYGPFHVFMGVPSGWVEASVAEE